MLSLHIDLTMMVPCITVHLQQRLIKNHLAAFDLFSLPEINPRQKSPAYKAICHWLLSFRKSHR